MRKSLFSYQNKKEWNVHGEADATKSERIIMLVSMWVGFIGCITAWLLYSKDILPMYWIFIFFAVPFIPFLIFFIRHFFIKKDAKIYSESYNIKGSYNGITGKDNTKITNYERKDKNNNHEGD